MKAVSLGALAGAVFSHWSEGHAGIRGYAPVLLRPAAALASFGRGQMRLTERRHRPHVVRTGNAPIVTRRGRTRWQASSRPISETEEDPRSPARSRNSQQDLLARSDQRPRFSGVAARELPLGLLDLLRDPLLLQGLARLLRLARWRRLRSHFLILAGPALSRLPTALHAGGLGRRWTTGRRVVV